MKRIIVVCLFIIICYISNAQQLEVIEFHANPTSIEASKFPKNDLNGERCGLVKLGLVMPEAIFEGNVVHKEYKSGEWWIYLTKGSRWLTIKNKDCLPLRYEFPEPIQSNVTYIMTVASFLYKKENLPQMIEELSFLLCLQDDASITDCIDYLGKYEDDINKPDNHWKIVADRFQGMYKQQLKTCQTDEKLNNFKAKHHQIMETTHLAGTEFDEVISNLMETYETALQNQQWMDSIYWQITKEQEAAQEGGDTYAKYMLDSAIINERVTRLRQELDAYNKACENESKDTAPKFDL